VRSKTRLDDLAIFGSPPAFLEPLHVGRPNIGDREAFLTRVKALLDRRWLTNNGPFVQELERRIADRVGVEHCVAICNGTIALELAIRAAGLTGEVIVPSFTFVATVHALSWHGITPVFCDVNSRNHTIDHERIEELINPRTTGIIGVHLWGRACDVSQLADIAARHRLTLLFDAAHAFGCSYEGTMIGNFGAAEVFSFHATKFMNSFEGGAVVTNDGDLARKIRLMANFGFAGHDHVVTIGTNGKMTEIAAAMGLTSLDSMDDFIHVNLANLEEYERRLRDTPGVALLPYDQREKGNYQYVIAYVDDSVAGLSRDNLLDVLWAENVLARRYFYPGSHRMEPYHYDFPDAHRRLPNTDRLSRSVLALPTGTAVGPDEIRGICDIIRCAQAHAPEVRTQLDQNDGGGSARHPR